MNEIIKKNGISFGAVYGLIGILLLTVLYVVDVELFISTWITTFKFAIFIFFCVFLLSKTKKEIGEIYTFKDAFTTYFLFATIGLTIITLFELALYNFIDPSLKETLKEIVLKKAIDIIRKFSDNKVAINEMIKKMNSEDQYSIKNFIQGHFFMLLMSAVFGFILAAIFKSKTNEHNQ